MPYRGHEVYDDPEFSKQYLAKREKPGNPNAYNNAKSKQGNWTVDHYFQGGSRENIWIGKRVIKYHKTLETYFKICKQSGFTVEAIRESAPQRANFQQEEQFERRKRIPLFLFFKLRKG